MIIQIIKFALDVLKLAPRYLITIGLVTAFLMFGPEKFLKTLSIYDFAQNYRPWLALVFLLVSALLLVTIIATATNRICIKRNVRKFHEGIIQRLKSLTEDEKQILRKYIFKQTKANLFRLNNGVVQSLVSAGILYFPPSISALAGGSPCNITEFAWDYLNKNMLLLEDRTG